MLLWSQVSDVLAELTQQDDLVAAAQALGFTVRLRDCVGGGQGAQCLQNLRHSFLILSPSAHSSIRSRTPHSAEEIVIDPTFKDNFIIAHPSVRYAAVLDALPPVFIGTLSKVQPLVELLCAEMALAFKEAGIVMPPWRSLRSMMTKWMPRRSLDLPLPASSHAAAAAACTAAPGRTASHAQGSTAAGAMRAVGMASAGAPRVAQDSTRLLRQACQAADNAHSSLGPSSTTSAIHSASSSNCSSSSSAGASHAAFLRAAVGCESEAGSPVMPAGVASTAAGAPAGARDVQHVLQNHPGLKAGAKKQPAAGKAAVACPGGASKGVKCFEPLQRVVGGFGTSFGFTPTLL
jgi:uncharacterized protein (TIGR01615 family)